MRLAVFVSPHGYGHAARTHAVLAELSRLRPEIEAELWTTVPNWFFEAPGRPPIRQRPIPCDVGLVQLGPTVEDLPATVAALDALWSGSAVDRLAGELAASGASAALCDIAPLGLAAAHRAGLPAILLENFTWDWIYDGYLDAEPRLGPWVDRLARHFDAADLRIRATPACPASPSTGARITVPPISRRPRAAPGEVRRRLGIAAERPMVLVSLGGIPSAFANLERWTRRADVDFVVPGGAEVEARRDNLVLLPHRTPVHHPDLVHAADVVVGKLGYSTVAEAFAAGTRFAYLRRPAFRESAVLERFAVDHLPARALDPAAFESGDWVDNLDELLIRSRPLTNGENGAQAAAEALSSFLPQVSLHQQRDDEGEEVP